MLARAVTSRSCHDPARAIAAASISGTAQKLVIGICPKGASDRPWLTVSGLR